MRKFFYFLLLVSSIINASDCKQIQKNTKEIDIADKKECKGNIDLTKKRLMIQSNDINDFNSLWSNYDSSKQENKQTK